MSQTDRPALCHLAVEVLDGAWSESLVLAALERPGAVGWVCPGDTPPPVGFLLAEASLGELHILTIGVAASARRRGVGRALVAEASAFAWRESLERIHLEVRSSNRGAIALYADQGFMVVGRRPRYYRNAEDAVLMTLERPEPTP